jgi:thioredoxin 1
MVLAVNQKTFSKEVLESSQPVLINFWAPWCGLCRLINPTLLKFESQSHREIKVVSINADENFKLANAYRLKNLPTLILVDRGRVIYRLEGFHKREELQRMLDKITVTLLAPSA